MKRLIQCMTGISLCASTLLLAGCGQPALADKPAPQEREFSVAPGQSCIIVPVVGGEVRGTFVGERDWWFIVHETKARQTIHVRKDLISQIWVTDKDAPAPAQ
jgi:hypothetical protein